MKPTEILNAKIALNNKIIGLLDAQLAELQQIKTTVTFSVEPYLLLVFLIINIFL